MPTNRLSGAALQRVLYHGEKVRFEWLALSAVSNGLGQIRFACTVPRKVVRTGVLRNRFKRWIREAFRRNQKVLPPGIDLVVHVGKAPQKPSFFKTEEALLHLFRCLSARISSLPRSFNSGGSSA